MRNNSWYIRDCFYTLKQCKKNDYGEAVVLGKLWALRACGNKWDSQVSSYLLDCYLYGGFDEIDILASVDDLFKVAKNHCYHEK